MTGDGTCINYLTSRALYSLNVDDGIGNISSWTNISVYLSALKAYQKIIQTKICRQRIKSKPNKFKYFTVKISGPGRQ